MQKGRYWHEPHGLEDLCVMLHRGFQQKHITGQICNSRLEHLSLLPTSMYTSDSCYRESFPFSNPPFKALGASFTLMAHSTSACEEGLQGLYPVPITFKNMMKQMKRKYDFQRCWTFSNDSMINLKKHMKGKQNKWRGFSRIFTVCVALLSLKVQKISP